MGLFKKKIVKKTYDREHMKPVIRASICTGEEVAGFKEIRTGKIEEIMLIRSPEDLERFKEIYPGNPDYVYLDYVYFARLLEADKQYDEAVAQFDKALDRKSVV